VLDKLPLKMESRIMPTMTRFVTEEEYLKMDTHAEYLNGELLEQPMTGMTHGNWCLAIQLYLHGLGFRGLPEITTKVAEGQWRLPDVLVRHPDAPIEEYPTFPPLMVFEVLSPSNTWTEMQAKFEAYEAMGVALMLMIDPQKGVWRRFENGTFYRQNGPFTFREVLFDLTSINQLVA